MKHQFFQNSLFPLTIFEWNKLDSNIRNSEVLTIFQSKILNFIRLSGSSIFIWHNPLGLKLFTRVRLGLCQLQKHKFKNSFSKTLNPVSSCGKEVETTFHFLLSCTNYSDKRLTFLIKIRKINPKILENTNSQITQIFLYGNKNFTVSTNFIHLNSTKQYILATKRFEKPLFR